MPLKHWYVVFSLLGIMSYYNKNKKYSIIKVLYFYWSNSMAFGLKQIQKNASSVIIPQLPEVDFFPNFLNENESQEFMKALLDELSFTRETYEFNGQSIQTKRQMSYHSEKAYSYSNQNYSGKAWTHNLLSLKSKIEDFTGYDFNAVLCNYYEDGEAGMGWHADKEKELGENPIIASLSLGQSRIFAFRHRKDVVNLKNPPRLCEYSLPSGSLLIMKGQTQKYFEHCVIKNKALKNERLNLTFRKVVT